MRTIHIGSICLLLAVSCGGGGGGASSDSGTGDMVDAGVQDPGTVADPGNPQDLGAHPEGVVQDDGVQTSDLPFSDLPSEPGAVDGYDTAVSDSGPDMMVSDTTGQDANGPDSSGACTAAGDCDDGNQCTKDVCVDGKCIHDCLDGMKCDDGDPFTMKDICVLDPVSDKCLCQGETECSNDKDCDDGNQCTLDACDKNGTCHNDCTPDVKCDDGNPDTVKDACVFSATGECACAGVTPGCSSDDDCPTTNEFCQFAAGVCQGPGQCAQMPKLCPLVWDPVCGCDGQTYGNECEAASAGVSVDYKGECAIAKCWTNDMCAKGEYCLLPACGAKSGECQTRPLICVEIWDPVCGCDGQTYGNECKAASAGVSVDYKGQCKTAMCWTNDMCAKGEYCLLPVCGSKSGECQIRPLICLDVWDPVCGCDGQTYGNECEAASAGVSVDYKGQCK
ncbi:MAG: hypothetical protein GXP54_04230 [Deltaproteobacteria bacterium]|nr:hypothetical protein [Deltaproteobacteria bacterium]